MAAWARGVRSGNRRGATGRRFRTVVNLGIGGSHLGPQMACDALAAYTNPRLRCRFVSNADGADLAASLAGLDPAETLFVVVSKSFTTTETMTNANSARAWVDGALGSEAAAHHFAAVSANLRAVHRFGISTEQTFTVWDWVGGRFSLASAAGLTLMAAIGESAFRQVLSGMRAVDDNVASQPLAGNGPLLMGLLAVWYRNFWGLQTRAVLPYSQRLHRLPAYVRQLQMESNGKRVLLDGRPVNYDTAAVVWGEPGTGGQHSFHQLLHQGTTVVPADLVVFAEPDPDAAALPGARRHHDLLVANCLAQAAALAFGDPAPPDGHRRDARRLGPHRELPGNRPSTLITAERLTPSTLGQLVALYEHCAVVQGMLWGVNPFDQFGVEHGKRLAGSIVTALQAQREASGVSESVAAHGSGASEGDRTGGAGYADPATIASLERLRGSVSRHSDLSGS